MNDGDRKNQGRIQARAMLLWGDSPPRVLTFLAESGFCDQEARTIIREAIRERRRAVQVLALKKIVLGLCMISIPAGYFILFGEPRAITVKIAALFGAIGIFGLWKLVDGCLLVLLPNSVNGSVSELGE